MNIKSFEPRKNLHLYKNTKSWKTGWSFCGIYHAPHWCTLEHVKWFYYERNSKIYIPCTKCFESEDWKNVVIKYELGDWT